MSVGHACLAGARLSAATKLGRLAEGAPGVGETTVFEDDALGGEEAEFLGQRLARGMAFEAAEGQIGRDDAVAGDLRRQRVGAEGLSDGPGGGGEEVFSFQ